MRALTGARACVCACGVCVRARIYACIIFILYYYICGCSLCVRVCVRVCMVYLRRSTCERIHMHTCVWAHVRTRLHACKGAHVCVCVCVIVCRCLRLWARANGRLRVREHSYAREAAQCLCMHVRVGKHACTRWRTCRCASVCVYMHVQCIVLLYYIIIIYAGSVYPYVCGYVHASVYAYVSAGT